ncbi:MAG: hypothetical protein R3268_00005 [Acidiferrobacterales bacterium]|nr:hypothetical protein [Acidiferrobacterales bacterium]
MNALVQFNALPIGAFFQRKGQDNLNWIFQKQSAKMFARGYVGANGVAARKKATNDSIVEYADWFRNGIVQTGAPLSDNGNKLLVL